MYRVLRTVDDDGKMLTDLPVAERLVGDGYVDYDDALLNARKLRTALYQHKRTGETRLLSELETTGSAYREDADEAASVWRFLKASTYLAPRGYALAVNTKDLHLFEPKPVPA